MGDGFGGAGPPIAWGSLREAHVKPFSSALLLLALASLAAEAHAGRDRPSYAITSKMCVLSGTICHLRVTGPADGAETLSAAVTSAGGDEDVVFARTGSRLHGAAPIASLPTKDAKLTLSLRDRGGRSVVTYSGVLWTDGSVTLKGAGLLAAEIVPDGGGYQLIVDLTGDAAAKVAGGSVAIEGEAKASEIAWGALEGVWEAKLGAAHDGALDVALRVEDAAGDALANTRTSIGAPWEDLGEGVGTVATDDDPLTTVGLLRGKEGSRVHRMRQLTVVSDGWDEDEAPKYADVDLGDGTSVTIAANSYQRMRRRPEMLFASWDEMLPDDSAPLRVQIDGRRLTIDRADPTLADLSAPLCAEGTCVMLVEEPDGYAISVTQYRWDTAFPTDTVTVELSALDDAGKVLLTQKSVAEMSDDVTVVFAQEVFLDGDPVGAPLAGRVRLRSDDASALANGRFSAALIRDDAGDLDVAGVGVDDVAGLEPSFSLLLGSEPSPCGGDDGWFAPPPLAAVAGNGSGTKVATTTTSTRPELL
jgi:hypothetical protein